MRTTELKAAAAHFAVDSLSELITQHELDSFKGYVQTLTPASNNIGNSWAQGNSGAQLNALSLMYEITSDRVMLDQVRYRDTLPASRNGAPVREQQAGRRHHRHRPRHSHQSYPRRL